MFFIYLQFSGQGLPVTSDDVQIYAEGVGRLDLDNYRVSILRLPQTIEANRSCDTGIPPVSNLKAQPPAYLVHGILKRESTAIEPKPLPVSLDGR